MTKELPSIDLLRQLLDYDPDTGLLTWKPRPVEMFKNGDKRICATWNTRYAGREALSHIDANGYKTGAISGAYYKAHRIAWKFHHGHDPKYQIDHINGDRTDNRIVNLRDVQQSENQKNVGVRSDNKTGYPGIWQKENGYYHVYVRGKYIGSFLHLQDAVKCRNAEQKRAGFHNNHGKRKGRPKPP